MALKERRAILVLFASVAICLFFWSYWGSWKPKPGDLVMVNTSGSRPVVTLRLASYDTYATTHPWMWDWEIEFHLKNKHREDLQVKISLEIDTPDTHHPAGKVVLVPGDAQEGVTIVTLLYSNERDTLPRGSYRMVARTELERKRGNEITTHRFEWELATGLINQTTKTIIPDKVPGEP